ncbi:cyclophilin-like fold protein [Acidovorax sp. LjRoot38]|uniref:cyclophilin-like fold protein n=1 Tax=Acidovorax sp. LjRoot38 TaxID=3342327 RepID=UPI003ED0A8DC
MTNEPFNADSGWSCPPLGAMSTRPSWYQRTRPWVGPLLLTFSLCGGHAAHATGSVSAAGAMANSTQTPKKSEESRMWMTIGERRFAITLADTRAAQAFAAMLPLTLDMEELNGNEKKKELPNALPTDTYQPGVIRNGDLLLWGSRTVVIFYLTFDSHYSYTRLGRVDDTAGLAEALGRRDVRVVFSRD